MPRAGPKRLCERLANARLTGTSEATGVSRCLRNVLREPVFASALVHFVAGEWSCEALETAGRVRSGASVTNGEGPLVLDTLAAPYSSILWLT